MPDVPVWTDCNQACAFCSNPGGDFRRLAAEHSFERLAERLSRHRSWLPAFAKFDRVRDYFTLTGGEPTLHPEFFRFLEHVKREFPERELRLLTNARRLAHGPFARRLLETAGAPFEAGVLVCGPDAATHERIAGAPPGSFAQTVRGLDNLLRLRAPGQLVEVRVVLSALQLPSLEATLVFLRDRFPALDRVVLIFVELEGRALWRLPELRLTLSDCGRKLGELSALLGTLPGLRLYHFPLCALPPVLWPCVWNTLDVRKVVFLRACRDCPARPLCVGVHKSYAAHVGTADLGPVRELPSLERTGSPYHPVGRLQGFGGGTSSPQGSVGALAVRA